MCSLLRRPSYIHMALGVTYRYFIGPFYIEDAHFDVVVCISIALLILGVAEPADLPINAGNSHFPTI